MKETDALDEYILRHIDEESDYLKALYEELSNNSDVAVNKELLEKLFLENINKNSAE